MKKNYYLLSILICSFIAATKVSAQSVTLEIQKTDFSTVQHQISEIGKLTFSENDMKIHLNNGQTEDMPMNQIGKMIFGTVSGVKTLKSSNEEILVYPNPASEFIHIKNAANKHIQVYSVNGSLMMEMNGTEQNQSFNISQLQKGIFVLKIDNKAIKFTKL